MIGLLCFVVAVLASPFKSRIRLEAENAALRHQLAVLRRKLKGRARLTNNDRWFFVQLYRWYPSILSVLLIIRPETLVGWHRTGFRSYWRWKSRSLGGRPQIEADLRTLIRRMSIENPLWGAPTRPWPWARRRYTTRMATSCAPMSGATLPPASSGPKPDTGRLHHHLRCRRRHRAA